VIYGAKKDLQLNKVGVKVMFAYNETDHLGGLQLNKVGGKAYNLARLSLNDFNVPTFFILDTDIFWDFLGEERKAYKELLVNYESTKLPEIRKIIKNKDFSPELKALISTKLREVFDKCC